MNETDTMKGYRMYVARRVSDNETVVFITDEHNNVQIGSNIDLYNPKAFFLVPGEGSNLEELTKDILQPNAKIYLQEDSRKFEIGGRELGLILFAVHLRHFFTHMENHLHTRQIDTQFTSQSQYEFQPLQILFRINPRIALSAGRLE